MEGGSGGALLAERTEIYVVGGDAEVFPDLFVDVFVFKVDHSAVYVAVSIMTLLPPLEISPRGRLTGMLHQEDGVRPEHLLGDH